MKTYFGLVAGGVYAVGFLAVQVHLLRFGILEISPLQAYYFLVGLWFLLCIAPAVAFILAAEYLLSSSEPWWTRLLVLFAGAAIIIAVIAAGTRFSAHRLVVNFNAYPYPSWYAYWNLVVINIGIILTWLLCYFLSRLPRFRKATRKIAVTVGIILAADSSIFFGRTIYPALDRGVGGGAPQFAQVTETGAGGKNFFALQIYAGENYLYLLELSALPAKFGERSAMSQFAGDSGDPVYRALAANQVLKLSNNQIKSIKILGFSQKKIIDNYFKDEIWSAPNPGPAADGRRRTGGRRRWNIPRQSTQQRWVPTRPRRKLAAGMCGTPFWSIECGVTQQKGRRI